KQKQKKNFFWRNKGKVVLAVLFAYLLFVVWPVKFSFLPRFVFQKNLVLFFNENEMRPCGGFLTAFGTFRAFPPSFEMKNSFAIDQDFGRQDYPISKVSKVRNFWDLGISPNLEVCSDEFLEKYNFWAFDNNIKKANNVIMVNFAVVEDVLALFGDFEFEGEVWNSETFFAKMSRKVADVDRHDEKTLENRKKPVADFGKKMILRTFTNPLILPRITRVIKENMEKGNVFVQGVSEDVSLKRTDFAAIEWNLGGGKSSRYLKKMLNISAREVDVKRWQFDVEFSAENTGGQDEPISQDWKGVFEIILPEFLGREKFFADAVIRTGEKFLWNKEFEYFGPLNEFSVFNQRGGKLLSDVSVSVFPQKEIAEATFDATENVGSFLGEIEGVRKVFKWGDVEDKVAPFVVLHEKIPCAPYFSSSSLCVEVHFNEQVLLERFEAELVDRGVEVPDVRENPVFVTAKSLPDYKTVVLEFQRTASQPNERFYLEIKGVHDFWENQIESGRWTVIDR
ncbi:MAG: hypothetical protein OEL89_03900, partial [Candidatus Peregrinibacteria bacterium]|nr:hypothetical protein [Candidatus Peregrinibacteria bacterium]